MAILHLTVLLCFLTAVSADFTDSCISCIGKVEGGGSGCNWDVNSNSCGRYQIKKPYWIDCGKLGSSWEACAASDSCAKQCLRNYMNRYARLCSRDLVKPLNGLSCYDYGRIHNGGPAGCARSATLSYVSKMRRYC